MYRHAPMRGKRLQVRRTDSDRLQELREERFGENRSAPYALMKRMLERRVRRLPRRATIKGVCRTSRARAIVALTVVHAGYMVERTG
jgi:hypothetical protein